MKILNKISRKIFKVFLNIFRNELYGEYVDDMFLVIKNMKTRGFYPKTIIDVGAYQGDWTKELIAIYPQSNYFMFEAQPEKQNDLKKISDNYQNTKIKYQICLLGSENKKNVDYYLMETGSSVLYENTNHHRQVVKLDMKKLDNFFENYKDLGQCILKIDVQGYELEVLKGATNLVEFVDFILLEVSTLHYNEGSPLFAEIIEYMNDIGFVVFEICSLKRTFKEKTLFQLDIFFSKRNHKLRDIKTF